jgi:hypothetical protein
MGGSRFIGFRRVTIYSNAVVSIAYHHRARADDCVVPNPYPREDHGTGADEGAIPNVHQPTTWRPVLLRHQKAAFVIDAGICVDDARV